MKERTNCQWSAAAVWTFCQPGYYFARVSIFKIFLGLFPLVIPHGGYVLGFRCINDNVAFRCESFQNFVFRLFFIVFFVFLIKKKLFQDGSGLVRDRSDAFVCRFAGRRTAEIGLGHGNRDRRGESAQEENRPTHLQQTTQWCGKDKKQITPAFLRNWSNKKIWKILTASWLVICFFCFCALYLQIQWKTRNREKKFV